ncbi:MAG TPA: hypothetical protein VKZ60_01910 [Chloroflexota bacterium]|nr:hypothetical protein [Chloroflexota bacterium]
MAVRRRDFLKGSLALACGTALAGGAGGAAATVRTRPAAPAQLSLEEMTLEASNLRLIGHHDCNQGAMGEGIAIQQLPNGRRIAYLAHESGEMGISIVDVTNPRDPGLLLQIPHENPDTRVNSLSLSGNILATARQTQQPGQQPAGLVIYDVSDPERPRQLSMFDCSGPYSRGCHFVWFVDGRYAHLSTGMPDFEPNHPLDDQIYVIVDLADPERPREVGRWWIPGMRAGEPPLPRHPRFDTGTRLHNVNVLPSRPDRAYMGWIDGGAVILDISDLEQPRLVHRWNPHPPMPGFTHTAVPHLGRNLMVLSDEALGNRCLDHPKLIWIVNIEYETNWVPLGVAPLPRNVDDLCRRGGRFGAHNQHENHEQPTAAELHNTVVGSFFNGGVRIYDIRNPLRAEEIAYFVPITPPGSSVPTAQINDMFVDERGLIYAVERHAGGLYILEYTGEIPLT